LFNQPIKKDVLPITLTHLTFGFNFNQPIEKDVLPITLTHLTLSRYYQYIIKLQNNLKDNLKDRSINIEYI
jgi:hypothetical protein